MTMPVSDYRCVYEGGVGKQEYNIADYKVDDHGKILYA
jgi:hypothetical protein